MKLFNAEQRIVYVVTGLGDNGKSLVMADTAYQNLLTYEKWYKKQKTEVPRHIALNKKTMRLAPWVEERFGIWPNGYIQYYQGLKEIHLLKQCDVFLDELGTNFHSRRWTDMTQEIIDWFNTLGHNEIFIYGSAQNFLDIDVTLRRKTQNVISLKKVMGSRRPGKSLPPVKRIWGLISMRYVHYSEMDKDEWKRERSSFPRPFLITKFRCSLYDTLQHIERTEYPPYECVERGCNNPKHLMNDGEPFRKFVHI